LTRGGHERLRRDAVLHRTVRRATLKLHDGELAGLLDLLAQQLREHIEPGAMVCALVAHLAGRIDEGEIGDRDWRGLLLRSCVPSDAESKGQNGEGSQEQLTVARGRCGERCELSHVMPSGRNQPRRPATIIGEAFSGQPDCPHQVGPHAVPR
jgi:hypothetical protein